MNYFFIIIIIIYFGGLIQLEVRDDTEPRGIFSPSPSSAILLHLLSFLFTQMVLEDFSQPMFLLSQLVKMAKITT